MSLGTNWGSVLGNCDKETAFAILDEFYNAGGNFIDTAVNYQFGQSEEWLGEWMASRNVREQMVIATKFSGSHVGPEADGFVHGIATNAGGNGRKNLRASLEKSLKRLGTDYVDLYYVHVWDFTTDIPELMQSLGHLVAAGKILHLGISDAPAWVVVKANAYARQHGLPTFVVYQGRWSAATRDFERDIISMCKSEGMGLAPWGALGSGYFKSAETYKKEQEDMEREGKDTREGRKFDGMKTGYDEQVSAVLEKIAHKRNTAITSVALAYVMHKAPYVFPIIGGRKVEHLKSNIEALGLRLSKGEIEEIEGAYPFELGFPHSFLAAANKMCKGPEDVGITKRSGHMDWVVGDKPILPHEGPLDAYWVDEMA